MSPMQSILSKSTAAVVVAMVLIGAGIVGTFTGNKEAAALVPVGIGLLVNPQKVEP